jgi:hypothetical protein
MHIELVDGAETDQPSTITPPLAEYGKKATRFAVESITTVVDARAVAPRSATAVALSLRERKAELVIERDTHRPSRREGRRTKHNSHRPFRREGRR